MCLRLLWIPIFEAGYGILFTEQNLSNCFLIFRNGGPQGGSILDFLKVSQKNANSFWPRIFNFFNVRTSLGMLSQKSGSNSIELDAFLRSAKKGTVS